jgi:hypothetical protein
VGHFKVRNNTGQIIYEMLNTDCTGMVCKGSYTGGPVKAVTEGVKAGQTCIDIWAALRQ